MHSLEHVDAVHIGAAHFGDETFASDVRLAIGEHQQNGFPAEAFAASVWIGDHDFGLGGAKRRMVDVFVVIVIGQYEQVGVANQGVDFVAGGFESGLVEDKECAFCKKTE